MLQINLSAGDLTIVKAILKKYVPEFEVWVYGSRVNGNNHEASDLDLVIRNPEQLQKPQANLAILKQAFIDSDFPFLVDIMDWACLPESYRLEIERRHLKI